MPPATAAWTCIDCATRYPTRVAWCSYCSSQGRVVLIGQRPSAAIDQEPESADAASLAALAGEPVPVRAYPMILTGHGALAVLWGVPGGGKSTMAARWLNAVQGPVLYVSHEEGLGPTIAARLKRLGISRRDFRLIGRANVDQVVAEIRRSRPVAVAIDSVQAGVWEASDLRHLLALHPRLSTILAVCQVNAKGAPEGRRGLIHEADLAVHVEGMAATVTKSRYSEITNGTNDLPVLPLSPTVAGDEVGQIGATILHMRSVFSPLVRPGVAEPRGPRDVEPVRDDVGGEDHDRPGHLGGAPDDAPPGRDEPSPGGVA
jgi:predicted ATP-dependent serine protease